MEPGKSLVIRNQHSSEEGMTWSQAKSLVFRTQLQRREGKTWSQARAWWSGINSHLGRGWPGARRKAWCSGLNSKGERGRPGTRQEFGDPASTLIRGGDDLEPGEMLGVPGLRPMKLYCGAWISCSDMDFFHGGTMTIFNVIYAIKWLKKKTAFNERVIATSGSLLRSYTHV